MERREASPKTAQLGFVNDAHAKAFAAAVAGQPEALEALLCRAAGWPGGKLNMKLAATFGAQAAAARTDVTPLLKRFGDDDAMTNTPRVFLPVCAAFGWVALLRADKDVDTAWDALCVLGADGRHPIQRAVTEALTAYCEVSGTDSVIERAHAWLTIEDRELRYGAEAAVLDLLALESVVAWVKDRDRVREYLAAVISDIVDAPRAAERSEMRRRALKGLPSALATVVARLPSEVVAEWLGGEVEGARHPGLREALANTFASMRKRGAKALADQLELGLAGSATPPRDPTRVREGVGRSKKNRRNR
jgi:hypothetical protein